VNHHQRYQVVIGRYGSHEYAPGDATYTVRALSDLDAAFQAGALHRQTEGTVGGYVVKNVRSEADAQADAPDYARLAEHVLSTAEPATTHTVAGKRYYLPPF
jgi:hypothetical protein